MESKRESENNNIELRILYFVQFFFVSKFYYLVISIKCISILFYFYYM